MKAIGKDKTVFLLTHYPLEDSRGVDVPGYGMSGSLYDTFTRILNKYPNTIHLYGHNHGGTETVYISEDTFERITSYTASGKVVRQRNAIPTSFISSFMGSLSYYNYSLNPGGLTARDPQIFQALMIYVYKDRIVFQMKNYGNNFLYTNQELKPWTVLRNMEGYVDDSQDKPTDTTDTSTNISTDNSDKTTDHTTDRVTDQNSDKTTDITTDKTTDKTSDKISDSSAGGTDDIVTDTPTDGDSSLPTGGGTVDSSKGTGTDAVSGTEDSQGSSQADDSKESQAAPWVIPAVTGSIAVAGGAFCLWYFLIRKRTGT